ncbi:MAG: type IV pilus twitching motility protein PilT [Candidatus Coatesbacteria bacterium]
MAKIDDMLRAALGKGGEELYLVTGQSAMSRVGGVATVLGGAPLATADIDGILNEVGPARRIAEAKFRFQYSAGVGHFIALGFRTPEGDVQAVIRKAALGEPHLEGADAIVAAPKPPAPPPTPEPPPAPAESEISAVDELSAEPAAPPPPPPPPPPPMPAHPGVAASAATPKTTASVVTPPPLPPMPAMAPHPAAAAPIAHAAAAPAATVAATGAAPAGPMAMPVAAVTMALASGVVPAINKLFEKMVANKASDLHLSSTVPPMIRVDGSMMILKGEGVLAPQAVWNLVLPIIPLRNQTEFGHMHDTDFAYEIKGLGRFRCNVFMDRKGPGAVFRIIPSKILTVEDLHVPDAVRKFAALSKGLVLVTGPTGSGKSTTLAAIVDLVNATREDHIITIEDPIEFVHENKKCLINQRELHTHTEGFKNALRAALREDPDIVLVGEMRDLETIEIAIETAETGHLVFGTLHTTTAPSTVNRIIEQFPADRQEQIRVMLSEGLKGVVSQTLCKKIGGGRIAALEILIINSGMANLIRENKTFQIPGTMQTAKGEGMTVFADVLADYVKRGVVEAKEAYIKAPDKKMFLAALEGLKYNMGPLMTQIGNLGHEG